MGGVSLDKTALGSKHLPLGWNPWCGGSHRGSGGRRRPAWPRDIQPAKLSALPLSVKWGEESNGSRYKSSLIDVSFFLLLQGLGLFLLSPSAEERLAEPLTAHLSLPSSLLFWKPKSCFCWAGPS